MKYSREIGYKVILVSNQPSIAKGPMSEENFEGIKKRMKEEMQLSSWMLSITLLMKKWKEIKALSFLGKMLPMEKGAGKAVGGWGNLPGGC